MPPALAFSFDREGRTENEIKDLRQRSNNKVHFLPRRMYENYLLDPEAIAAVISGDVSTGPDVSSEVVQRWLEEHMPEFLPSEVQSSVDTPTWLRRVNGAALLNRLFPEVSDNTVSFNKVRHGARLTEWIIEKKREHLTELDEYLNGLLAERDDLCK